MSSKYFIGFKKDRLTIIDSAPRRKTGVPRWLCLCKCGKETVVENIGNTKSCGCAMLRHGMSQRPEYHTWKHMLFRCKNPKATKYYNYGGRGISVCERWEKFENFYEDMGDRPKGFTLDRIDQNGNYEPSNCKWASAHDQNRNKRTNHTVVFNDKTCIVGDLAKEFNIAPGTLSNRLNRGWSLERAISEPIHTIHRRKKIET